MLVGVTLLMVLSSVIGTLVFSQSSSLFCASSPLFVFWVWGTVFVEVGKELLRIGIDWVSASERCLE